MTCLHYARIAYTVVDLVSYLSSYARHSCANVSSLFRQLSRIPLPKKYILAMPNSFRLELHKLWSCGTHVTWIRLAHAPETVFPYPRQSLPRLLHNIR